MGEFGISNQMKDFDCDPFDIEFARAGRGEFDADNKHTHIDEYMSKADYDPREKQHYHFGPHQKVRYMKMIITKLVVGMDGLATGLRQPMTNIYPAPPVFQQEKKTRLVLQNHGRVDYPSKDSPMECFEPSADDDTDPDPDEVTEQFNTEWRTVQGPKSKPLGRAT